MVQVEKIGRFGIGFNAVYHVTDVPCFVSGGSVVFLDPYTTHLNDRITNVGRPGVRINFLKKNQALKRFNDQFQPFHGLFGCNIVTNREEPAKHFNGTLFRLPLRTQHQVKNRTYLSFRSFLES